MKAIHLRVCHREAQVFFANFAIPLRASRFKRFTTAKFAKNQREGRKEKTL